MIAIRVPLAAVALSWSLAAAFAQKAPSAPAQPAPARPVREMSMRVNPLMHVIDADHDGEISATELANALPALKTLDRDGDGKLSAIELRPVAVQPPGATNASRKEVPPADPVTRMMSHDKNGDGKLTEDELPEPMRRLIARADADKDGVVTREELENALSAPVRRRDGPPASGGRPPGPLPETK